MTPSILIRGGFVWLLVSGLLFRILFAVLLSRQMLDEAPWVMEWLGTLGLGRGVAFVTGWALVVVGVALLRQHASSRALTLALALWGIALFLDIARVPLPYVPLLYVVDGEAMDVISIWFSRASSALTIGGAAAAIVHARDRGVSQQRVALSIAGVGLFALFMVSIEVLPYIEPRWLSLTVTTLATAGLYGGLAVLPWAREAGAVSEPVHSDVADPTMDFLVGGLFFVGGMGVTLLSLDGGIDGRMVLAWGPILYGGFRLVRGISRVLR